jgi:hypothetical protein
MRLRFYLLSGAARRPLLAGPGSEKAKCTAYVAWVGSQRFVRHTKAFAQSSLHPEHLSEGHYWHGLLSPQRLWVEFVVDQGQARSHSHHP